MSTRGLITDAQKMERRIYDEIKIKKAVFDTTQAECGKAMDVTQSRVSQIFHNQRLTVKQLCDLADYFGMEVRLCEKQ